MTKTYERKIISTGFPGLNILYKRDAVKEKIIK